MPDDALRLTIDKEFERKYKEESCDSKVNFCSPFHLDKYNDNKNLWKFVCDLKEKEEKYICEKKPVEYKVKRFKKSFSFFQINNLKVII